jgi:hypothetical protein
MVSMVLDIRELYLLDVNVCDKITSVSWQCGYQFKNSGVGVFSFWICFILTNTQSNGAVTHPLFSYTFQNPSLLHWQS